MAARIKTVFLFSAGVAVLVGFAYFASLFIPSRSDRRPWTAYLYSSRDNGLAHDYIGEFDDLVSCKNAATGAIKERHRLPVADCPDRCDADRFLCGRNCAIDAAFGSVFIEEYLCEEKYIGP